jgi:hypothetical protein
VCPEGNDLVPVDWLGCDVNNPADCITDEEAEDRMVRLGRFELPTPALGERCSIP